MDDETASLLAATTAKPIAPQRPINSCLTCRRRKVRCDHKHPICSACQKSNNICLYSNAPQSSAAGTHSPSWKVHKPAGPKQRSGGSEIGARLDRLEGLLEKAIADAQSLPRPKNDPAGLISNGSSIAKIASLPQQVAPASEQTQTLHRTSQDLTSDDSDGTLLMEGDHSHFVSSMHWALLADEIHDIKTLLADQAKDGESFSTNESRDRPFHKHGRLSSMIATPGHVRDASNFLPDSLAHYHALLDIFFANVDPMAKIVHRPTLTKRFHAFARRMTTSTPGSEKSDQSSTLYGKEAFHRFEPLAYAIFYSAINSMRPPETISRFNIEGSELMDRFRRGLALSLRREEFLTSHSIEVLQAFILLLTTECREDDMGETWALMGLAIRLAQSQGLHREPTLFPSVSMDVVQVEVRRRLWHQICHLDYRSAESRGQEPTISDDDYTTFMPTHLDDDDLIEGVKPVDAPKPREGLTEMSVPIIRLEGIHNFRRIVQKTYRLERRIKMSKLPGGTTMDPVAELHKLFRETETMTNEMRNRHRRLYLRHLDPNIPINQLTMGLAEVIEWRGWVVFWLRIPRPYREEIMPFETRCLVFENSIKVIESICFVSTSPVAVRFQWHVFSHAAFQAIMHLLSELRNPIFQQPMFEAMRVRAIKGLRVMRDKNLNATTNSWKVIRKLIDKVCGPGDATKDENRIEPGAYELSSATTTTAAPAVEPASTTLPSAPTNLPTVPPMYDMVQVAQQAGIDLQTFNYFNDMMDATLDALDPFGGLGGFQDSARNVNVQSSGSGSTPDFDMDFWSMDPSAFDGMSFDADPRGFQSAASSYQSPTGQ